MAKGPAPIAPEVRVWRLIEKTDDHWLWTGARCRRGYGHFNLSHSKQVRAHRFVYELLVGPIPEGLVIDHLCRVANCVRPDHLEPVTRAENDRRRRNLKTHCINGHEFTEDSVYIRGRDGIRVCKECAHIKKTTTPECPRGHIYAEVGVKIDKLGRRWCLGCYPGKFERERDTCPEGHPYTTADSIGRWCGICPRGRPKKS
jgi:hypothetical protein